MPPRRDRVREELDALKAVTGHDAERDRELIRAGLHSTSSLVIARAAGLASELGDADLTQELVSTYLSLAEDPFEMDKGCLGMKAILGALFELEAAAPDVYKHAIRHVQFDSGTFSEDPVDSAAELRGVAAHAMVRTEYPEALEEISQLLLDEPAVRMAAVRALRAAGSHGATLLLRMALLMGERDPETCYECFAGLLEYSGRFIDFVGGFLAHEDPNVASIAALAVGEHGGNDSLERLIDAWRKQTNPDLREAILNAIASIRSDAALDFLIDLVRGEAVTAIGALQVLNRFQTDRGVVERVRQAAESNARRPVIATFQTLFK